MGLVNTIYKFFSSLWPPGRDEDPTPWRKVVFFSLALGTLVVYGHIAASGGYLEDYVGIKGYASSEQVEVVSNQTHAILYAIYAPQIREKVRARCEVHLASEREKINRELDRILQDYEEATGSRFSPMPNCGEV